MGPDPTGNFALLDDPAWPEGRPDRWTTLGIRPYFNGISLCIYCM